MRSVTSESKDSDDSNKDQAAKKKLGKLEGFFGVNKLPAEQLFEQRLAQRIIHRASITSEQSSRLDAAELDPDVKRAMLVKSKKLKEMLGTMPDEHTMRKTVGVQSYAKNPKLHDIAMSSTVSTHESSASLEREQSLATLTDMARELREDKEYRRKKLDKIRQFLGERISTSDLNVQPKPDYSELSAKERQNYFRRVNKLQGMFGEIPPNNIVSFQANKSVATATDASEDYDVVNDEDVLLFLLSTDKNVEDLVEMMDKFDVQEGVDGQPLNAEVS